MRNPYMMQQDTPCTRGLAPFDYRTNSRPEVITSEGELTVRGGATTAISGQPTSGTQMVMAEEGALGVGILEPETLTNPMFVPGYLRTQIGKIMRVEFLIGNQTTDRVGRLLEVGASYILLREISGASTIMCDLFSIKFASIVNGEPGDCAIVIA